MTSSVLRWPDKSVVDRAVREWAAREGRQHPDLLRLGYFGSYARGDWGVGSDLDLVAVVADSALTFESRAVAWDLLDLPVPAELLVYTVAEWDPWQREGGRFATTLQRETVWVYPPAESP